MWKLAVLSLFILTEVESGSDSLSTTIFFGASRAGMLPRALHGDVIEFFSDNDATPASTVDDNIEEITTPFWTENGKLATGDAAKKRKNSIKTTTVETLTTESPKKTKTKSNKSSASGKSLKDKKSDVSSKKTVITKKDETNIPKQNDVKTKSKK